MRAALVLALAALAAGCGPAPSAGGAPDAEGLAASEALPERFGHGRPATAEEIARLDIDVMPDGRGLPPGSGTVAEGAAVYAARCAICHGPDGEGTPTGQALVSGPAWDEGPKTVGNYWPYATTLFDYIRRAMPFDRPGTLTDEEVYAVSAYLLYRNELIGEDAALDAASLAAVEMPAHGRFVPDDREGTNRVR